MMQASLIIAAGGSGSRFQKTRKDFNPLAADSSRAKRLPSKLFYPLAGKPLLAHTIQAFQNCPQIRETIIAAPTQAQQALRVMALKYRWRGVKVIAGGASRAESVWKALKKTSRSSEWVLVHDGARPFVSKEALNKLFAASRNFEAIILGKKVVPTIKEIEPNGFIVKTVDRANLAEAETPQIMRRKALLRAYAAHPNAFEATDESSLMEYSGTEVHAVTHEGWNPKITAYQDFELAEAYLNQWTSFRTGLGRDTHRLVEKRKFLLGGVRIPFEKGPLGHSDGDALLHALTDAILGAMGAGDIGDWFSDKDKKNKNIASTKMLQAVLSRASEKGYTVTHVDSVIVLEKPKLGSYKNKIKNNIAKLLGLPADCVSVKAKTAEGLGPEGQGLAITCEAIVTVKSFKQPF